MPVVYFTIFVNILRDMNVEDDALAQQMECDRLAQPENAPDRLYSFNSAEGAYVRNIITSYYKEHIPYRFHYVYYFQHSPKFSVTREALFLREIHHDHINSN